LTVSPGGVDEARVRRWLVNLARPELLADAEMTALLHAHGRGASGSPVEVGRAGVLLLSDAVDSLAPPEGSPAAAALPYRVLRTCFVEGVKNSVAAERLGLSERQLSRERARAVALLATHLAPPASPGGGGLPPPLPAPFLPRPGLAAALQDATRCSRRVHVTGPDGSGKTTLVAAHARSVGAGVFWCRAGLRSDDGLPALLFELGEHLVPHDASLASYVRGALPDVDVGLATRIAIAALAGRERLLVLDGWGEGPAGRVDAFLDEAAARLPLTVVTIARRPSHGRVSVHVPGFSATEVGDLLALHGVTADPTVVAALQKWSAGNPRLVAAAAGWLATGAGAPLKRALRRRSLLLTNLRGLARASRRVTPPGRAA
jgi:hypothetical protein